LPENERQRPEKNPFLTIKEPYVDRNRILASPQKSYNSFRGYTRNVK